MGNKNLFLFLLVFRETMASSVSSYQLKNKFINVGEIITKQQDFMKGHGVIVRDGDLIASVAGFIEQTNKLIFVRPIKTRYVPEVGDVIVGRVTDVCDKWWSIDIGAQMNASLVLSAIHLPGGVHRRRTEEDALEMRTFFKEGHLISAEIQSLKNDGGVHLQTRNLKYGKLINGIFVKVNNCLIKRSNKHFISCSDAQIGVDIVLGNNGFVWLTNTKTKEESIKIMNFAKKYEDFAPFLSAIPLNVRSNICRIRNCLLILDRNFVQISLQTIMSVYDYSIKNEIKVKDMLARRENDMQMIQNALYIVQRSL